MKPKVLVWADTPTCATGFATVSRNILKELRDEYEFDIVGINHNGWPYDKEQYPYTIYPACNALVNDPRYRDVYGRQLVVDLMSTGQYMALFIIQDTFIVETVLPALLKTRDEMPKEDRFVIIHYFPIDASPATTWVKNVVAKVDIPVAYTEYAKKECVKIDPNLYKMPVVYHGVDKDVFKPVEDRQALKKEMFGDHADKFIVLNVSRNQPRKDLYSTFAAFKLLKEKSPNSFLFILAQNNDVGGNLKVMASQLGLEYGKDWVCPPDETYGANQGWPIETVVKLYNAADVVMSTTLGEGFGLSTVEAMACKTPLVMPGNTALTEILQGRGFLVGCGKTLADYVCMGSMDSNLLRPVVDIEEMADTLLAVQNGEGVSERVEEAYAWVPSWKEVGTQWKSVFSKAMWRLAQIRK
jgi:glycosyltransferase involved in cell wall biosynthesis